MMLSLPFFKINFYWSIVDLRCHVSFCCTASESAIYTYMNSSFSFFLHRGHYAGLSRVPWAIQEVFIVLCLVAWLCLTLCDPMACSRFSLVQIRLDQLLSRVPLFVTP